jgi:hypothetical protein
MDNHKLGILRGLIQASLAVHKGATAKAAATTPAASAQNSDIVQGLIADVENEILTEIENYVASTSTPVVPVVASNAVPVSH